jgi:cytochrome c peroxidase
MFKLVAMKKFYLILAIILTGLWSCNQAPKKPAEEKFPGLLENAKALFSPITEAVENPGNPITKEKIMLGQTLYFDKRLSVDESLSCNSCHNLKTYGVDNESTSDGVGGQKGDRNSPTVLNAAFHFTQFWDGRAKDVEEQAGGPILNPVEMAMPDQEAVLNRLRAIQGYRDMFAAAFPDEEEPINYANLEKSIGAFERKLITPSRFDEYLLGYEEAITPEEKKGLQTFINTGCVACHTGAVLGGNMYQKFGLMGNYWDFTKSEKIDHGRFVVTKNEGDKLLFKVPSLRNIEKTHPFFHDGSVDNLEDAVRIIAKLQLDKDLTDQEVNEIVAFMKTLTGTVPEELTIEPEMPQ